MMGLMALIMTTIRTQAYAFGIKSFFLMIAHTLSRAGVDIYTLVKGLQSTALNRA